MESLFRPAATILTAFAVLTSLAFSSPVRRGEDPEFQAAWRIFKQKECSKGTRYALVSTRRQTRSVLPVESIGDRPVDICATVRNRIRYARELGDNWQSANETWMLRTGDCEDFAIVVRDLCRAKGIAADVYAFHSKAHDIGHAVTIGSSSGGMWMSSNGSFQRVRSISDARSTIARSLHWNPEEVSGCKVSVDGGGLVKTAL